MRYLVCALWITACAPAEKHMDQSDGGTHDSPGSGSGSGSNEPSVIQASWKIKTIAGVDQGCPAGYDQAVLKAQQVDDDNNNVGAPIMQVFPCADMAGTSQTVPRGMYYTSIEIANTGTAAVYATSVEAFVDLTVGDNSFNVDLYTDGGYITFAWTLSHNSNATSCALSALTQVEAITTNTQNAASVYDDTFTCSDGNGVTSPLPAGTYTVSIDALTGLTSRGMASPVTATVTVPNRITDLGVIAIPID